MKLGIDGLLLGIFGENLPRHLTDEAGRKASEEVDRRDIENLGDANKLAYCESQAAEAYPFNKMTPTWRVRPRLARSVGCDMLTEVYNNW